MRRIYELSPTIHRSHQYYGANPLKGKDVKGEIRLELLLNNEFDD